MDKRVLASITYDMAQQIATLAAWEDPSVTLARWVEKSVHGDGLTATWGGFMGATVRAENNHVSAAELETCMREACKIAGLVYA